MYCYVDTNSNHDMEDFIMIIDTTITLHITSACDASMHDPGPVHNNFFHFFGYTSCNVSYYTELTLFVS